MSLYPEFKHVFVGDNGQGDVRAAEMMAERYPGKLEAVYVHRVRSRTTIDGNEGRAGGAWRAEGFSTALATTERKNERGREG